MMKHGLSIHEIFKKEYNMFRCW